MTISSVQLPLYFNESQSPALARGKGSGVEHGSASVSRNGEAHTGAATSKPDSGDKAPAAFPVARSMDIGGLLPALQGLHVQETATANARSAYADAVALIGADAPVPPTIHHSEADYALNP